MHTMMTAEQFEALGRQGFNRVPLVSRFLADLDTPMSLYLKLAREHASEGTGGTFLLESVVGGERFGRYSFIGLRAPSKLVARGFGEEATCEVITDGQVVQTHRGNPLEFISAWRERFKVALPEGLPRFCGGLAGYFGYDAVRHIEPKLAHSCPPDALGTPDIVLLQCEELAVIDNLSGHLYFIVYADPAQPGAWQQAQARLAELRERLRTSAPIVLPAPTSAQPERRDFAKADFLAAVQKAKDLIAAGEFMQVQVGQRISKGFEADPLALYRALRSLNPSPYMYFYDFGDFQIVGSSPEILVRQEKVDAGEKITIRPLAGTRARGDTPERDRAIEAELLADPKERAEHVMLIDLARNDIGRIAKTGTVHVSDAFIVERYSHVMHIVSNVEGILQDGMDCMDVLRATFPAGTLSGAPKVHAMEVIDQLEPVKRGIYGGAVGYISFAGNMDMAIAIRTGLIKDGQLHVQAAAGVVADSVPELEWQETEHKARALLRAAAMVEQGLE